MKTPKQILSLTLACIILAAAFASCGDADTSDTDTPKDNTTDDTAAVDGGDTEEQRLYPDLPTDLNYDGYEFSFLHWSLGAWESTARASRDLYAESLNGETINDAVYGRNLKIEETYNVKISLTKEDAGVLSTTVINNVAAMDDVYDVVYPRLYEGANLVTQGLFYDLHQLPHLDLEKPWWDQNAVKSLSIDKKLYLVATDININDKDATAAVAFNKQLAENYKIDDLYQAVRDGKWTYDYMMTTYADVSTDLDGNSAMDKNDLYGFLGKNDVMSAFFHGSGGRYVDKDSDDIPYLSFMSDRNVSVTQKLAEMVGDAGNFFNHQTAGMEDSDFTKMFEEGHGLFFWMRLDEVTNMRASDTDFGILPTPKFDEAQTQYWNTVSHHTTGLMSVPVTSDAERTSVILEALAAESKYTVQPAYYDVSLKGKSTRDEESGEMLEIIIAGRVFDLGSIYAFGGFEGQYMGIAQNSSSDIVSIYTRLEKSTTKAIDNFVAKFQ